LLSLVLRDELPLRELDLAEIVVAFVARLAERDELDLEACGEFLILISALLELKARGLFPDEDAELAELEPEEAAEELARRLAEYRRAKDGAAWLSDRLEAGRDRFFRLGPAPLAPARPEPTFASQKPARLADALRALAVEPPALSTAHLALLELCKQGELAVAQAAPFAPIRISRADRERSHSWNVRSA